MNHGIDFSHLASKINSKFITRQKAEEITDGAISEKRLANLDSLGEGPEGKIYIGRKAAYPVESFIQWLENRCRVAESKRSK